MYCAGKRASIGRCGSKLSCMPRTNQWLQFVPLLHTELFNFEQFIRVETKQSKRQRSLIWQQETALVSRGFDCCLHLCPSAISDPNS